MDVKNAHKILRIIFYRIGGGNDQVLFLPVPEKIW